MDQYQIKIKSVSTKRSPVMKAWSMSFNHRAHFRKKLQFEHIISTTMRASFAESGSKHHSTNKGFGNSLHIAIWSPASRNPQRLLQISLYRGRSLDRKSNFVETCSEDAAFVCSSSKFIPGNHL